MSPARQRLAQGTAIALSLLAVPFAASSLGQPMPERLQLAWLWACLCSLLILAMRWSILPRCGHCGSSALDFGDMVAHDRATGTFAPRYTCCKCGHSGIFNPQ